MGFTGPLSQTFLRRMSKSDRAPLGKAGVTTAEANAKHEARLERELHNQISGWLRLNGYTFVHSRMDRKTTQASGVPDYNFPVQGKWVSIEVKLPGKDLSEAQEEFLNGIIDNKGRATVAHSLDDVIQFVAHVKVMASL